MKKFDREDIIVFVIAGLQFSMTVAVTVILALFKPVAGWQIVFGAVSAFAGMVVLLFSYEIAYGRNVWYSLFHRDTGTFSEDDKPSLLAVLSEKIGGYTLLSVQLIFLFF